MESSLPEFISPAPRQPSRLALRALQLGIIAVIPAVVTWRQFELDRFYVPKELVLHVTALGAGVVALRTLRRFRWTWLDSALLAVIALGVLSAILAQNGWLATRALTMTASAAAVFWVARMLAGEGHARGVTAAVAAAVVLAALTSLLQAYGLETDIFSINRAPGGTLGNRNSVAHMAAFGMPLVLLASLTSRTVAGYFASALGCALLAATLVLTRSRAGWLAVAAALALFIAAALLLPVLRRRVLPRFAGIVGIAVAAVAGAVLLPNSLRWVDENPYLSSMRDVANYREGSGAGRLVQYRQSLKMAAGDPLLGVGPGNWAVAYPAHAARRDPSMDPNEAGRTANPWPSSDWVAFGAERGFIALILLLFVFGGMALTSLRRLLSADDAEDALGALALLCCMGAAVVAGMFDAVLLLAAPSLIVFAMLGANWVPAMVTQRQRLPAVALVFVLVLSGVGALRSTAQLTGMGIYANNPGSSWLKRAALIDPGNYALRMRLARGGSGVPRAQRCDHARAAHDLFPSAAAARSLSRSCR